jgi:hypothetical protein
VGANEWEGDGTNTGEVGTELGRRGGWEGGLGTDVGADVMNGVSAEVAVVLLLLSLPQLLLLP